MTTKDATTGSPAAGAPRGRAFRASDAERERTAETLRKHYETGHIGYPEFDHRMERAYQATYRGELGALVADLPGAYHQRSVVPATAGTRKERGNPTRTLAIVGLVIAALVGLSWLTSMVTAHPLLTLLAAVAVVWVLVKKPFHRRG